MASDAGSSTPRSCDSCDPSAPLWCLLCGAPCGGGSRCRFVSVRAAQEDVRSRCIPSAFHYASVMAMRADGRELVCQHCVNWRRRSRKAPSGGWHGRRRAHTPLDRCVAY